MSGTVLEGLLFDGRTAAATPVRVQVGGGVLHVTGPAGEPLHEAPLRGLAITEAFASAPRQITLAGGALVEVQDGAALTAALAAAGHRAGLVDRLEQRWPAALGALVASIALVVLAYMWGLPAAARVVAARLPEGVERRLGDRVLDALDGHLFHATLLGPEERAGIERRVAEAASLAAPGLRYRVLFRSATNLPGGGVNAFALPGGTIVLLDELVRRLRDDDDQVLAVVAHELGHVARRHSTQALLKGVGVGAFTTLLWGDFSGQAASLSAALALLDYSRAAETEADEDGVRFLRAAGRTTRPMLGALCMLATVERESGLSGLPRLLSSHPHMPERIARVRELGGLQGADAECPPAPDVADREDADAPAACRPEDAPAPSPAPLRGAIKIRGQVTPR